MADRRVSRRRVLRAGLGGGVAGFAGCTGTERDAITTTPNQTDTTTNTNGGTTGGATSAWTHHYGSARQLSSTTAPGPQGQLTQQWRITTHNNTSFTPATGPIVVDGTVYAAQHKNNPLLVASNAADGTISWAKQLNTAGLLQYAADRLWILGVRSSQRRDWLYGVNPKTGETEVKRDLPKKWHQVRWLLATDTCLYFVVIGGPGQRLVAVPPGEKTQAWAVGTPDGGIHFTGHVATDSHVYTSVVNRKNGTYQTDPSYPHRVQAHAAKDGSQTWQRDLTATVLGVDDTHVYAVRHVQSQSSPYPNYNELLALDRKTGETVWRQKDLGALAVGVTDTNVIVLHEGVTALDLNTGKQQWSVNFNQAPDSYAVTPETLYVVNRTTLQQFATSDGTKRTSQQLNGKPAGLAVAGQTLYASDKGLTAYHVPD